MCMRGDLARLFPIRECYIFQATLDIESMICFFAAKPRVESHRNIFRSCCHRLECFQDRFPCVFNGNNVSKSCADTEDVHLLLVRKLFLSFCDENLTRIVVPKACIDELNVISPESDRLEKGRRSRCCPCHLPDRTSSKTSRRVVCREEGWWSIYIIFSDG